MENFKWTDELVKEFINKEFIDKYNSPFSWITGIDPIMGEKMKEFKKSRQSKKEYIILRTVTTCSSEHPGRGYIWSVQRLPDGEIFSSGDRVTYYGATSFISNFIENENGLRVTLDAGNERQIVVSLNDLKPMVPQQSVPLFIAEDGKPIFNGETYWHVSDTFFITSLRANLTMDDYKLYNNHRFSTRKLAEEYIIENKPCLSLKEVGERAFYGSTLRDLVKSKL